MSEEARAQLDAAARAEVAQAPETLIGAAHGFWMTLETLIQKVQQRRPTFPSTITCCLCRAMTPPAITTTTPPPNPYNP